MFDMKQAVAALLEIRCGSRSNGALLNDDEVEADAGKVKRLWGFAGLQAAAARDAVDALEVVGCGPSATPLTDCAARGTRPRALPQKPEFLIASDAIVTCTTCALVFIKCRRIQHAGDV